METEKRYDVSIVGGGLAGLTLAIQLTDSGYSCVLFEKNTYPFHRVCGEYISNESKRFLVSCGLDMDALKLPSINKLRVSSPSGKIMEHQLDLGGFGISRHLLDQKLAEIAKGKGVNVLEDCRVTDVHFSGNQFNIVSSKGNYSSEICAGAWGKKSNLDTKLERTFSKKSGREKNYVGIKYHVSLDFPDDVIELHNFENGYCGISKVEEGRYCLCYLTDADNLKKFNGNIKGMEKEVLMQNPFLKQYFSTAKFLFEEPLAISNIRIGNKNVVDNHIFMLGDAAGNIAPLSGNGMSMAMKSSFDLCDLLKKYFGKRISREELEHVYGLNWKRQFRKRIALSGVLQKMLKNTSLTNTTITMLKRMPGLRDTIVRSTHGKPF